MTRPTGWDVVGYSSDPVPGNPKEIRALAKDWSDLSATISTAHTTVTSAYDSANQKTAWQGDASEKFLKDAETVKEGYTHASTWFADAATAVDNWATALEQAQQKADAALAKAKTAKSTLDTAQSTHDTAQSNLEWYRHQTHDVQIAYKENMDSLGVSVANATQDITDAQTLISRQKTHVENAKQAYDNAAKTAVEKLQATAQKFNKAPAQPGTTGLSYDAHAGGKFGAWTVHGGGVAGEHGSAGYTVTAGVGGLASSDAGFDISDGKLEATASATAFIGATASADGRAEFHYGPLAGEVSGTVVAMVGALATAKGSLTYKDGKLDAEASASASAEAKATAKGAASIGVGGIKAKVDASGTAQAGAAASADAKAHIGYDGISAKAGVDTYAGARAGVEAGGGVTGADAKVGAGVRAGIGFSASAGADLNANDIGVSLNIGGALGIGADVNLDVHVHPADMVKGVGDTVKKLKFW